MRPLELWYKSPAFLSDKNRGWRSIDPSPKAWVNFTPTIYIDLIVSQFDPSISFVPPGTYGSCMAPTRSLLYANNNTTTVDSSSRCCTECCYTTCRGYTKKYTPTTKNVQNLLYYHLLAKTVATASSRYCTSSTTWYNILLAYYTNFFVWPRQVV